MSKELPTIQEFYCEAIKENGYFIVYNKLNYLLLRKIISKNQDGFEEEFDISVYIQESGYVSFDLTYRKKLAQSTDKLIIEKSLGNDANTINQRITKIEEGCLLVGRNFL